MKRVLMSVFDKTGIVSFAKELKKFGVEIISTGGTFKTLKESGVDVTPIEEVTKFPEMLDGRVKTLHPNIHGGLLARRDLEEHVATCREHQIGLIDMVVVNLYPFEKTIAASDVTLETAIENIDIGGPSMLRSAAKNYKSVAVVVDPSRYEPILSLMKDNKGELTPEFKAELACDAFSHTARYDAIIASYLTKNLLGDASDFPGVMSPIMHKVADLRYGENPHQKAAFYKLGQGEGIPSIKQLHGKELSYNNIVDIEAAAAIVKDFGLPGAAIIKHTNPCGAAIANSISDAYKKAYEADPVSSFGCIVGLNRAVDKETAEEISQTFVEVVVAPGFDDDAVKVLSKKPSIRLIVLENLQDLGKGVYYKFVDGGFLLQTQDDVVLTPKDLKTVSKKVPSSKEINDLLFAFSLVKHVKSNAILIAKDGQAIGVGAGQMSRVESMEIALKKAGDKANGAVIASDAFFPFRDSIDTAAKHGIAAVIQPGGSKRDQESIDSCDEHGISMVFTGIRHFKH